VIVVVLEFPGSVVARQNFDQSGHLFNGWESVPTCFAQPNPDSLSLLVHLCHLLDLSRFLFGVSLVDTDGINPYRTWEVKIREPYEGLPQIEANEEDSLVTVKADFIFEVTGSIGNSMILRRSADLGASQTVFGSDMIY
jgi:hypothetical protein